MSCGRQGLAGAGGGSEGAAAVERGVKRIAGGAAAARDRPAGEGACVEGGEQVERAAGVGAAGERARAGVEVGDELGESGGVGRVGVGRETLPGLREAVALLVGGGARVKRPLSRVEPERWVRSRVATCARTSAQSPRRWSRWSMAWMPRPAVGPPNSVDHWPRHGPASEEASRNQRV